MIRISAKVDYAVQALVQLARSDGRPVTVTTLAADGRIPRRFLAVTLGELRRAELVESRRGSHGGFWLARPPDQITIAHVFEAIDGDVVEARDAQDRPTSSSWLWTLTARSLENLFDGVTIADVVQYAEAGTDGEPEADPSDRDRAGREAVPLAKRVELLDEPLAQ